LDNRFSRSSWPAQQIYARSTISTHFATCKPNSCTLCQNVPATNQHFEHPSSPNRSFPCWPRPAWQFVSPALWPLQQISRRTYNMHQIPRHPVHTRTSTATCIHQCKLCHSPHLTVPGRKHSVFFFAVPQCCPLALAVTLHEAWRVRLCWMLIELHPWI
jgi:hypothetical protein